MTRSVSQPGMELLESLEGTCPYPGLYSFQTGDAPYFFGRESLVQQVLERLQRVAGDSSAGTVRMLSLVGQAGIGKTSLLQAGLLDALRRNQQEFGDWKVLVLHPGEDPVGTLAKRLREQLGCADDDLAERLSDDQRTLHSAVQTALENAPASRRVLVVVDACEDLLTLCRDGWRRFAFVNNLAFAAGIADGKTIVLLVGRDESVPDLKRDARLAIAFEQPIEVGPLFADELSQAIEMPARAARCRLEPGFTERLITEFARSGGSLLHLQHALRETWRGRDGWLLSNAAYERTGGMAGAIANTAESLFASLSPAEQTVLRRVALRFVQPGDGSTDSCRVVDRAELDGFADERAIGRVLVLLSDAHFVRLAGPQLELAHESLLRLWTALAAWRESDRDALRTHRRLTLAANRWVERGRDERQLFRGELLAQSEEWLVRHRDEANHRERQFLAASRAKSQLLADAELGQAHRLKAESLQQNLQAATQGKREAERLARQFESRASEAETGRDRAERDLVEARTTVDGLRSHLQVSQDCVAQLERRVVTIDQDRETLSQTISARMSECSRLESQLRSARDGGMKTTHERAADRELLSAVISARMSEVSRLERRLAETLAARGNNGFQVAAAAEPSADRELLSAVVSARMSEVSRLERRLAELSSSPQRLKQLAAERDAREQELSAAQTRVLALEQSVAALQKSADAARQATSTAEQRQRGELERLRQETERQQREAEKHRHESEKQRVTAERQRQQNQELSKSMFWSNSIAIVAVVAAIVFLILWQSNSTATVQRLTPSKRSTSRVTTVPSGPSATRNPSGEK